MAPTSAAARVPCRDTAVVTYLGRRGLTPTRAILPAHLCHRLPFPDEGARAGSTLAVGCFLETIADGGGGRWPFSLAPVGCHGHRVAPGREKPRPTRSSAPPPALGSRRRLVLIPRAESLDLWRGPRSRSASWSPLFRRTRRPKTHFSPLPRTRPHSRSSSLRVPLKGQGPNQPQVAISVGLWAPCGPDRILYREVHLK